MILNYQIIQKLGEGSSGNIYLVSDQNGQQYALKEQWTITDNEKNFAEKLIKSKPSYLIQYYQFFSYKGKHYFVMEYANGGDLYHYLLSKQPDLAEMRNIVKQVCNSIIIKICLGVQELHKMQLIHRDLKPENVVLVQDCQKHLIKYKICDFGLIKDQSQIGRQTMNIGTPYYQAPELIVQSKQPYDNKVDIWSLACLIYEIYSRVPLFTGQTIEEIQQNVKKLDSSKICNKISKLNTTTEIKNILIRMLNKNNPKLRPNIDEVVDVFSIKITIVTSSIQNSTFSQQDVSNQQQQIQVASQNQQQQQQFIENPQKMNSEQNNLQNNQFTQQLSKQNCQNQNNSIPSSNNQSFQQVPIINQQINHPNQGMNQYQNYSIHSVNCSCSQQTPIMNMKQNNQGVNNQIKIMHLNNQQNIQIQQNIQTFPPKYNNLGVQQDQSQLTSVIHNENKQNQAPHQSQQQNQQFSVNQANELQKRQNQPNNQSNDSPQIQAFNQSQQQSQVSEEKVNNNDQGYQQNNFCGYLQNQQQGNNLAKYQNINQSNNQVENQTNQVEQLNNTNQNTGQQQEFVDQTKNEGNSNNQMQQLANNQQQNQQTGQSQSSQDGPPNDTQSNQNVKSSNQSEVASRINLNNQQQNQVGGITSEMEIEPNIQESQPKTQDMSNQQQQIRQNKGREKEQDNLLQKRERKDSNAYENPEKKNYYKESNYQEKIVNPPLNNESQFEKEYPDKESYNNQKLEQSSFNQKGKQQFDYSERQSLKNTNLLKRVLTDASIQLLIEQKFLDKNFTKQQFQENKKRIIDFLLDMVSEQ